MRLSETTIDEVRRVPILELAYKLGDPVKRAGTSYQVPCPNPGHYERTPDTYISPSKNIWTCFGGGGCGAKGSDAITYYAWHEFGGWDPKAHFVDAVIGIAELMGIQVEYDDPSNKGKRNRKSNPQRNLQPKPMFEEVEAQDAYSCDLVYRRFLELCPIYKEHASEWLGEKRRYTKEQVLSIGLRSVPQSKDELFKIINTLMNEGMSLDGIPGFTQVLKQNGNPEVEVDWYWTINARQGYFIPVRDHRGRIVRLRVSTNGKPKYVWFSSNPTVYLKEGKYHFYDPKWDSEREKHLNNMKKAGAPSGAPINVVPPTQVLSLWQPGDDITSICRMDTIVVTEGEHKSNISSGILKMPVIGVPGVGNWRDVIRHVAEWGTSKLAIAYDMDALKSEEKVAGKNQEVFAHLVEFASEMLQHGIEVVLWTWNMSDGKGLDDILLKGKYPTEINLRTKERKPVLVS